MLIRRPQGMLFLFLNIAILFYWGKDADFLLKNTVLFCYINTC